MHPFRIATSRLCPFSLNEVKFRKYFNAKYLCLLSVISFYFLFFIAFAFLAWEILLKDLTGRSRTFGANMSRAADLIVGGWQTTSNMFAKTGTGFTPFWICDNCGPALPGNIGVTSLDAVGDFNAEPSYRPVVLNNSFNHKNGDQIWNPNSLGLPTVGTDVFSNPQVA